MRKRLGIILAFYILFLAGCSSKVEQEPPAANQVIKMETKKNISLNIETTDKLLYSMVKSIVKDSHSIEYVFKNKDALLSFKFSNDSLNNIAKKDLFIYLGAGFEPWINDFVGKLNKSKVGVINASRGVKLLSYNKEVKYNDMVLKDNPYYLLNIDNYKIALMNIKNAIQDKDPKNRDVYEKNFSEQLKNLEEYQRELKTIHDKLTDYTFIVVEDELNYFIRYNDFKTIDLTKDNVSNMILPKDANARLDLESKLKDNKHLVVLYNNDIVLKNNEELIKKYNIRTVNIIINNDATIYEAILKYNIENLKRVYEGEQVKK